MKELLLEVYTPSSSAFAGKVSSVTVPGEMGNFQVLYNHAPLLSSLVEGTIKVLDIDNKLQYFKTSGGMVEVLNNRVLILAESFEQKEN
ncbi:MAG: F0F1 ATP synthase subunit epsilon [Melioribacteraceae bacterium]|nr:F0F1 ATP synthase subunit epsilon [Melioribacteraceae bacterium]